MGGFGSGKWKRHAQKLCAEDCFSIECQQLRHALAHIDTSEIGSFEQGALYWRRGEITSNSTAFLFSHDGQQHILLTYRLRGDMRSTRVNLSSDRLSRLWFICPLCDRRVGVLYLNGVIACRTCHNLTYRSAQSAHAGEQRGAPSAEPTYDAATTQRLNELYQIVVTEYSQKKVEKAFREIAKLEGREYRPYRDDFS